MGTYAVFHAVLVVASDDETPAEPQSMAGCTQAEGYLLADSYHHVGMRTMKMQADGANWWQEIYWKKAIVLLSLAFLLGLSLAHALDDWSEMLA